MQIKKDIRNHFADAGAFTILLISQVLRKNMRLSKEFHLFSCSDTSTIIKKGNNEIRY